jgi:vitamin K-dependent gamma-carboxylase-like protein
MTVADARRRFEGFWFAPELDANLVVARVLLAATALWVVLSRFDLPSVLGFPIEMWAGVPFAQRIRFAYLLPLGLERSLYALLHILLIGAMFGIAQRATCILSGLLLIHFAPLESILWVPNPYLRGLTIPALGLMVFGFAGRRDFRRWPLLLTQFFFAQIYFFAGYAKIFTSGFGWIDAANIRRYLLLLTQFLGFDRHSLSYAFVDHPVICALIAWAAVVFDLVFPIVIFKPATRWVMLPLAVLFHIGNAVLFHVVFQEATLLLLFVNWQPLVDRVYVWRSNVWRRAARASS